MLPTLDEAWKWLKTAPLPVVLAFVIALAAWVWTISDKQVIIESRAEAAERNDVRHDAKIERQDAKLDRILEIVVRLQAAQEYMGWVPPKPQPAEKAKKEDK